MRFPLGARRARGALIGAGQLAGKSRKIRMPHEYENFTAGIHGASVPHEIISVEAAGRSDKVQALVIRSIHESISHGV